MNIGEWVKKHFVAVIIVFIAAGIFMGWGHQRITELRTDKAIENDCAALMQIMGKDADQIEQIIRAASSRDEQSITYNEIRFLDCWPSTLYVGCFENREAYFEWTYNGTYGNIKKLNDTYTHTAKKLTELLGKDKVLEFSTEENKAEKIVWSYDEYNLITLEKLPISIRKPSGEIYNTYNLVLTHTCTNIG